MILKAFFLLPHNVWERNCATVKCAACYMLHSTYAWLLYTFPVRTLHTWCFSTPLSRCISHSLTLWCQAEYKPHVHESKTSISCQFMRRLWIIKLWQPGTWNEQRGDKIGRMRKEIRELIHFSCAIVYVCVCAWLICASACLSVAREPACVCVLVFACTDIVLTLC